MRLNWLQDHRLRGGLAGLLHHPSFLEVVDMPGSHVTFQERVEIARLRLELGMSFRAIGRVLGRAHTTMAREFAKDVDGGGAYHPSRADRAARARRARPKLLLLEEELHLALAVAAGLRRGWSPQQVSGRLRREHPGDTRWRVSHTAIYNAIDVLGRKGLNAQLELALRSGRYRRRARAGVAGVRGRLPNMVMISDRPSEVADRVVPGHWEGDLVEGARKLSAVATLVERKSRYLITVPLHEGKTADKVAQGVAAAMVELPASLRRSLTWDQGKEMARHVEFTIDTGIQVYFCDPHSPWQRPSNENHNGLLREYYPKGCDFNKISPEELQATTALINERPRKVLDYATPAEVLSEMIAASTGATTD